MISKKILFVSVSEKSASTRYRALNYFSHLRHAGWQPEHFAVRQNPFRRALLLKQAAEADAVVVLRKTFSGFYPKLLRSAAKILIFDFDDAIFMHSNCEPSRTRMKRFARLVEVCDQVWAGNGYLAESAKPYNPAVATLATSINPEEYDSALAKPANTIDLVWIGSSSTKKYLFELIPALESLNRKVVNLRLKIIADFTVSTSKLRVTPVAWSPEIEARELASSHIGIAPIPDDAWTRGKCGLKVLQYMAAGLPVVASPCGVQTDMVQHGVSGLLARSLDEWHSALLSLASDFALRKKMGEAGMQRVTRHFSTDATFARMISSLDALLEPRGA
ncbi:MAG: glycosyltransferase family 4 protein [Candidatus Binatia bacterium]